MEKRPEQAPVNSYMLTGTILVVSLLIVSWYITSRQLEEYEQLNESILLANKKLSAINNLEDIARQRTRLSHAMLIAEDVFERDEIGMKIASMAGDFIDGREHLMSLDLAEQERIILQSQLDEYPVVIDGLERVADLAIEDTPQATQQAMDIIVKQVVPAQRDIITGFGMLKRYIEDNVQVDVNAVLEKKSKRKQIRIWLMVSVIVIFVIMIVIVMSRVSSMKIRIFELSNAEKERTLEVSQKKT